jgi:hypothetical protein
MAKKKVVTTVKPKTKAFVIADYSAEDGDSAYIYHAETAEKALDKYENDGNDSSTVHVGEVMAAGFTEYKSKTVYAKSSK